MFNAERLRTMVTLGLVLFAAYAYFYQLPGWNQNSRIDLVRAIVERGTLRIDEFQENTGDKAFVAGHYYSDKAPGQALVAVPAVGVASALLAAIGKGPGQPMVEPAQLYVATVVSSGIPTVVAALCLFWIALRCGATRGGAIFAALVYGLGTPAWVYATLMMGNNLAAATLTVAFAGAVVLRRPGTVARDMLIALFVGLAAGWAVLTEYPAAPAALLIGSLALSYGGARAWSRRARLGAFIGIGAIVPAAILATYNLIAFGSVLSLSYAGVEGFVGMHEGIMGVTFPKVDVLQEILLGEFRGLLPLAPVIAVAPIGLWLLWRRGERGAAFVGAAVALYYVVFNASYVYWDGGHSYGPRFLGAALPFLCLGLAPLWTAARRLTRVGLALVSTWGVVLAATAATTSAMPPLSVRAPVREILWPAILGQLTPDVLGGAAKTPAQLFGLVGPMSLVPLLVVWLLGLVIVRRVMPGFWRASEPARGTAAQTASSSSVERSRAHRVLPPYPPRDETKVAT